MTATYNVLLDGTFVSGFDQHAALTDFASLIKRDEAFAQRLMTSCPKSIKSDLTEAHAERYIAALGKIGISAYLERHTTAALDLEDTKAIRAKAEVKAKLTADTADTTAPKPPKSLRGASLGAADEERHVPALWNPNAAANWSLVFSPILGAYLQMRNWEVLGEPARVERSRGWLLASLIFIAAFAWAAMQVARGSANGGWLGLPFVYLCLWYFASAKDQVDHVRTALPNGYVHKPWLGVLCVALILAILFQIALSAAILSMPSLNARSVPSSDTTFQQASSQRGTSVGTATAAVDPSTARPIDSAKPEAAATTSIESNSFLDQNYKTETNRFTDSTAGGATEGQPPAGFRDYHGPLLQQGGALRLLCKYERADGSTVDRLHTVDETRQTVDEIPAAIFDDQKIVYDLPKIDGIRNIVIIDRLTGHLTVTHVSASAGPQPVVLTAMCSKVSMQKF